MRILLATDAWAPQVNGVVMTLRNTIRGVEAAGHLVQVIGPDRFRSIPCPTYPEIRLALGPYPRFSELARRFAPDVVHIATEGPLGRSALQAARALGLPVCSDFRTNFHAYSAHYGFGVLRRPIIGYLRRFHNATRSTMVPTEALRKELAAEGFDNVTVVSRGVDLRRFDPARRSDPLRAQWGAMPDDLVVAYVGRLRSEERRVGKEC